jgi:hypothetical protein
VAEVISAPERKLERWRSVERTDTNRDMLTGAVIADRRLHTLTGAGQHTQSFGLM